MPALPGLQASGLHAADLDSLNSVVQPCHQAEWKGTGRIRETTRPS